ncbi:MAG: hypothetical protein M8357_12800 [Desulfobulbaceae bacterium]|nr:hypothetical protein [Desulfobulbaceae bacterium]
MTILTFFTLLAATRNTYATEGTADLASQVTALELGMNGYTIGAELTAEQKKIAAAHPLDNAFAGTYKFIDNELVVVVADANNTVLALYQRQEGADVAQARKMVSALMGQYGDPTAMAHDKLIYWAYKREGKISEEEYNQSKEKPEKFSVLATVKFSSEFPITEEIQEGEGDGTIYFIVSSDRLTEEFTKNK